MNNTESRENKNVKALFSVVCLCIIALGLIVYFSNRKAPENSTVNENRTLAVSETEAFTETETETEVHRRVKVKETEPETQKPSENKKKKAEPSSMPQGENNTPYKSYYKYPLTEAVLKGYSEELVYDEVMGDWRAHPAVDFKGNAGDKVVAVNDGIVTAVYNDSLYGLTVEIDHGGKLVAKYCGLESVAVKEGTKVNIGNKIGTLGKVPCEDKTNPHLHFETKLDGKFVNPLNVMSKSE